MNADDLTREQCDKLNKALYPTFCMRSRKRTMKLAPGFLPDDPVYKLVARIQNDMQQLGMELHYRAAGKKKPFTMPSQHVPTGEAKPAAEQSPPKG
jgi:hypothetical protein